MIRRLLLVVGIIVSLSSCGGDIAYRIEGKLTNLEDQTLYAVFENEDIKVVDTVTCGKPGEFLIEKKQGDFREVTIFFADKMHWVTAYLEKGEKVTITGDVDYPAMLRVKGGRINDRLSAIRKEMAPLLKEQADLIRQLNKKNRENLNSSIEEADMASRLANVNHLLSEEAAAAIKKYPDEEASVVLIQHYFNHPDDTRQMDELLAVLNPKLNDFYLVRKLQEYSTRAKRTALGAEAPGFNVKNIYGTPVSLDSFPKKYLLLAFTAPWCDMCQTEDLYLDEVAMKYPKEKVDMLLVSLDDDQAEVRKVLAKDSIGWNLVTDSAGQAAMLVDLYNVSALPRCFLIDEEGKIILKTDNGVEIKQTLEKLME
ncbi:MAG: redoxin domain-containing protein [Parabacteroides merdae]|jgi:peroxiredoxin|nr:MULTISPECIES: TlpA disulfide reductase family protein [Parabacteroides]MBS5485858.1 AhpC/TSA family protein [Parabacteroides sp.]MCE9199643.1 AhpC/TSA family protein [Parabacteroides merdae]